MVVVFVECYESRHDFDGSSSSWSDDQATGRNENSSRRTSDEGTRTLILPDYSPRRFAEKFRSSLSSFSFSEPEIPMEKTEPPTVKRCLLHYNISRGDIMPKYLVGLQTPIWFGLQIKENFNATTAYS
jgi:hypothetical protein